MLLIRSTVIPYYFFTFFFSLNPPYNLTRVNSFKGIKFSCIYFLSSHSLNLTLYLSKFKLLTTYLLYTHDMMRGIEAISYINSNIIK